MYFASDSVVFASNQPIDKHTSWKKNAKKPAEAGFFDVARRELLSSGSSRSGSVSSRSGSFNSRSGSFSRSISFLTASGQSNGQQGITEERLFHSFLTFKDKLTRRQFNRPSCFGYDWATENLSVRKLYHEKNCCVGGQASKNATNPTATSRNAAFPAK
ncbi:hypothetical protein [Pseudomonas sp. MWU12-2115]|uniref:hypothetical protein n=1 Tax=Pseudomonas sp. MWU12-2115 TaxID=2071713 RepID=UPI0013148C36